MMIEGICELAGLDYDGWTSFISTCFFFAVFIAAVGPIFLKLFPREGVSEEDIGQMTKSMTHYFQEADLLLNLGGRIYRRVYVWSIIALILAYLTGCELRNQC